MRISKFSFAILASLGIASQSQAAVNQEEFIGTLFTFSGVVERLQGYATDKLSAEEVLAHYTAEGLGSGQAVEFQVGIDFSRQGQQTRTDGVVSIFQDVPLTRACDTCITSYEVNYDYAELLYSSIAIPQSAHGSSVASSNLATSYFSSGMTERHEGYVQVGRGLFIESNQYGFLSSLVYNWAPSTIDSYYFGIMLDDGTGVIRLSGTLKLDSVSVVPVPAAGVLMFSGLFVLGGFFSRWRCV